MSGIVLGAIAVTNPWDFPTYGLVLTVGAVAGMYLAQRRSGIRPLGQVVLWMATVAAISTICYLPFKLGYQTVFSTGIGLTRDITPDLLGNQMSATDMRDALVTPLRFYLEHFGFFVFAILSYVILVVSASTLARERLRGISDWFRFALYYRDRPRQLWRTTRAARSMVVRRPAVIDPGILAGWFVLIAGLLIFNYFLLAFLLVIASLVVFVIIRD